MGLAIDMFDYVYLSKDSNLSLIFICKPYHLSDTQYMKAAFDGVQ